MSLTSEEIAQIAERTAALLDSPQSPWRSARGIAQHLHFTEKTVHNLTGPQVANPIPFHRLTPTGEKRFHVEEVDAWLLERKGVDPRACAPYVPKNLNGAALRQEPAPDTTN